jgi:hypothetical protein
MRNVVLGCYAAWLVRTDVSEEHSAAINKGTRVGELGTLALTSNRPIFPPKRRFLQEPHGVTPQKTPFLIVFTVFGAVLASRGTLILQLLYYMKRSGLEIT